MNIGIALAFSGATLIIQKGIKLVDDWIHRIDRSKEKVNELRTNFDSISSEIGSLNSELAENGKRIDELNAKPKLTYAEKGELEELQEITKELERQVDIKNKQSEQESSKLTEENIRAFNLEFKYDSLDVGDILDDIANLSSDTPAITKMLSYEKEGIDGIAAAYLIAKENKEQFENTGNMDSADIFSEYADYYNGILVEKLATLQSYKDNLQSIMDYRDLTAEEEVFYNKLEQTSKLIYTLIDPNKWNDWEIQDIFNTEGIEKTKDDLISLAEAGKLDENVLLGFKNLSTAISECDLVLQDGQTNMSAFIDEMYGLVDAGKNIGLSSSEPQTLFTQLSANEESLDKFQSSVKSAADAYTTLLSGNYSSSQLLDSIQAINQAATDMGDSLDWETISTSENPLQSIQDAIESVSKSYAESVLSDTGIDTDSKFGQMLANIVQESYKSEAQLSSLNTQIDSLQSAYDDLTDIVNTYNETGHITFDQLQTLLAMEPQYLSCLIDENGQLSLNQGSLLALSNQRLNDAEAQAVQQAITELGQLELQDEKAAVEENALAFNNAVNDLAVYNAELANTISEASVASSVIRDLNAAINNAESKGASDVQIDTVLNNLNTKLQLIKKTRTGLDKNLGNVIGGKSSSSSKSSAAKSDFEETVDFFKQRTKDLNDALSLLKKNMDNVSGSFGKNNLIDAELGITEEKFNNYTDALSMYTQKANEALSKLPADIAAKVKNGAVALTDFVGDGNKDVVEAIKDYESWKDMIAVPELILE